MEQTVGVFLLPCLLVFAGWSVMLAHCEVLSLLAAETPAILYKHSKCGGNYPGYPTLSTVLRPVGGLSAYCYYTLLLMCVQQCLLLTVYLSSRNKTATLLYYSERLQQLRIKSQVLNGDMCRDVS